MTAVMIILNCWQRFGRRYFWQRLLLGVVTATLGLPALAGQPSASDRAATIVHAGMVSACPALLSGEPARLLGGYTRLSAGRLSPWDQLMIRQVIRRLSLACLHPLSLTAASPILTHHRQDWLDLLSLTVAPVTVTDKTTVPTRQAERFPSSVNPTCHGWRTAARAIRAGPDTLLS